ncbi:MAG: hypothetical protein E7316_10105 [Clostridiales bacterium]|nr:hypothetical protein [Clostridiales bacterium]
MKQRKIALGPGAASLILIIVALSMCILCMLTYISAKNDLSLSNRSADMIQRVYTLNDRSERSMAALDAVLAECAAQAADEAAYLEQVAQRLPAGMEMEDDIISWMESEGDRALMCAVQLAPLGEEPRLQWTQHALTVETEDAWN